MRFQVRDGAILKAIQEYGGVLARRHMKRMFWPHATLRAMQKRLSILVRNDYLSRPSRQHRQTRPISEPVYWLNWKGILWVAQSAAQVTPPANAGENQLREFAKRLREQGIRWLREPRWFQLPHDLAVVDFRLMVEQALESLPTLYLEEWIHEGEFRARGDTVTYKVTDSRGRVRQATKRVIPDSYFVIVDKERLAQGSDARIRCLLEWDHGTQTRRRVLNEKIVPGMAYIKSSEYRARFGINAGYWLIVTTGKRRMDHLRDQAEKVTGAKDHYLFSIPEMLSAGNILTSPVWRMVEKSAPVALVHSD